MRIGVSLVRHDEYGEPLDAHGIAELARRVESVGLNGIWTGSNVSLPGSSLGADSLTYLSAAAQATEEIELGTCIFVVPLREKHELAQRFSALELLYPRRFTIGVGTGSGPEHYAALGLDWEDRFRRMDDHMATVRSAFAVPPGTPEEELSAAQKAGPPRFVLGAWQSQPQLRRAAAEYDGWMGSAGKGSRTYGWRTAMSDAIKRYRDLGGQRAILSTVSVDLYGSSPIPDEGRFNIHCPPEEAAERLHMIEEFGYDDVILSLESYAWEMYTSDGGVPGGAPAPLSDRPRPYSYSLENLEHIRSLIPPDAPIGRRADGVVARS